MRFYFAFCLTALLALGGEPARAEVHIALPRSGLSANEIALLINEDDPLSRQTGEYYQRVRNMPPGNIIRLHFPAGKTALSVAEFAQLKQEIDRQTRTHIQGYAVAWTQPYRVDCMSMTSALALGYDQKYCSNQCGPTAATPYFNSPSTSPYSDHHMRPAMLLAGTSFAQTKALIDRGMAAESSFPEGKAYLLNTSDKARTVRAALFESTGKALAGLLPIEQVDADFIEQRNDVLFYFTGLAQVPHLDNLSFNPGALADHLTSSGGQLTDSTQMSSLRWLEAGATASYGTVIEPCNHPQKFPLPAVAMFHYLSGASALEAYWKSVAWPGEGVFIGDPLAHPFAPSLHLTENGFYELKLISPQNSKLRFEQSDSMIGPFQALPMGLPIQRGKNQLRFRLPPNAKPYFRLSFEKIDK